MLAVIFIGLLIMPLSFLFFGGLFLKQKVKFLDLRLFYVSGLVAIVFDFFGFYKTFQYSFSLSQWSSSASVMGEFSLLASIHTVVFGLFVVLLLALLNKKNYQDQKNHPLNHFSYFKILSLMVLCLGYFFFHIMKTQSYAQQANLYHEATSDQLTVAKTKEILEKAQAKQDIPLMMSVLENPSCPDEVLAEYSHHEQVSLRTSVATNQNISTRIIDSMADDQELVVRMKVASSAKVSNDILLKYINDSAKEVRKQAHVELKLRHEKGLFAGEVPPYRD